MSWILVSGALVCCWAILRTMGAERERRVMEMRYVPPPPAPPPTPPVAKKPASAWPTKRPPAKQPDR